MLSHRWILNLTGATLLAGPVGAARSTPPVAPAPPPVPRLVAPSLQFDAGSVRAGQVVRADFLLRNTGRAPLHIEDVKKECGCTDVTWDSVIEPGKTGHLRVALHTEKFRGAVEKHVRLLSNDPKAGALLFIMKAVVPMAVEVLPGENIAVATTPGEA